MPQDGKIDYLELPAKDFDTTQAFYEKVFGWAFTDYGPDYRAFNDGKMDGGFYPSDKSSSTKNGAALIIFYSSELEKVYDKVVECGGEIVQEIFSFPGGRRFHFSDPNGNELAVWSDKGL